MAQTDKSECCSPTGGEASCCKVEALISIDERGQTVLPKETRDKADIQAGDKLAVISWEKDGKTCCLTLIKAEELTDMVRNLLGPLMQDVIRK